MLGKKVACAALSPHLCNLSDVQVPCNPPLRQLHFDFGDFNNGVCHFMKIATAESTLNTAEILL